MSSDATPGYPAPLTACMVTAITVSIPKRLCSGARARTSPIAEQFELVTTKPPDLRFQDWQSISLRWSGLTSGMTRGTSFVMRSALELVMTAQPASAKRGSSSAAMEVSSAAKITLGAPSGFPGETRILATRAGMAVFRRQRAASAYSRPSERSEAASHATSNQGWVSSIWIKRCPTMPVAPRIPTGILVCIKRLLKFYNTALLDLLLQREDHKA